MVDGTYTYVRGTSPSWPYGFQAPVGPDGRVIKAPLSSKAVDASGCVVEPETPGPGYDVERVAKVALRRLSELQRGEHFTRDELRRRLGEIREAGYPVPAYSQMKRHQLDRLYIRIRADVWTQAERRCPYVAEDMKRANKRQQEQAWA